VDVSHPLISTFGTLRLIFGQILLAFYGSLMFSLAANQGYSECLISLVRISLCTSCLVSAGRHHWKIGSGQIDLDYFLLDTLTKEVGYPISRFLCYPYILIC
jgi:hypothetical protein